jgi:hypothetical protein
LTFESFKKISFELVLNSRVSTGGWNGIERAGEISSKPLSQEQVEFVFWCLKNTPCISEAPLTIDCEGKSFDRETFTLDGEKIDLKPVEYPRIKCPSIRLHWTTDKDTSNVSFSTADENAYWLERGMEQEMVHIAGAIAQLGINMIGGTYVDLVPMIPYLTEQPPEKYVKGNLTEPLREGETSSIECIRGWELNRNFKQDIIIKSKIGQILWAGNGCTPHKTFRYHRFGTLGSEGQGKTTPSASATYTTSLYVIDNKGLYKYLNWDEKENVATHSLGMIRDASPMKIGEFKNGIWVYTKISNLLKEFRNIISNMPEASTYIIVASNGRLRPYFSLMEAGYSVLHMILQAKALNLAINMVALEQKEMRNVKSTIGLIDTPLAVMPLSNQ